MAKKNKNKKVKNAAINKEYPIMWLTLGKKDAGNTLRTIDWKTGKEIESDLVFKHNGEIVRISALNKIFGPKNYVIGQTSKGRYFVRHHKQLDPTDAQGLLHDWSKSDNEFDKTLAEAYKNTGLTPPDGDVETVQYYRPGWFNDRSREVPNLPILTSWGSGTGVDLYQGSTYNSKYQDELHSDPTGVKSLFGQKRVDINNRAWLKDPVTMLNWKPEIVLRNTLFDTYNNYVYDLGLPKIYYQGSFDDAYSDARGKGQKTFIWDNNLYNTDYSGTHHKLYEKDLKSGKVDRWYSLYPNFTYPELRMAKLEELNTYGITNELTSNKDLIDNTLVKIPARGYDIEEAVRAILGEYSAFKEYKTAKELQQAIYKTYPFLKGAPVYFKEAVDDRLLFNKPYVEYDIDELSEYLEKNNIEFTKDLRDILSNAGNNPYTSSSNKELHRNEYNLLLGYPMTKILDNPIPSISYYRTGTSPYYFTNNWLEESTPLLPSDISSKVLTYTKKLEELEDYYNSLHRLLTDKAIQLSGLSKLDWYSLSWGELEKYYNEVKQKYPNLDKENLYAKEKDNFISKFYNNMGQFKESWFDKGLSTQEGFPVVYDMNKLLASVSDKELDDLIKYGVINLNHELNIYNLQPGNYLTYRHNDSGTNYYNHTYYETGKYSDFVNKGLGLLRKYNIIPNQDFNEEKAQITDKNLINSASFGRYTVSVPEKKDFISVYDEFDIDPFGSGNVKSKFTVGKPFEYYTRFYRDSKPNIDELYKKFNLEENK